MGIAARLPPVASEAFASERIERVFNDCFSGTFNTRLLGGASEPLYQPATSSGDFHALYYRSDYFASALHEVAHWCIAGEERRLRVDFGYWYAPDGRSAEQQRAFECAERKPQALEWFFSQACAYRFQVSADNLALASQHPGDALAFQRAIREQALIFQKQGLPARADTFYRALCREFGTAIPVSQVSFALPDLS